MTRGPVDGATTVEVRSGAGPYPVIVGAGLRAHLARLVAVHAPAARYAVVSDDRVAPLHGSQVVEALLGAGLDAGLHVFPAGEASKTRSRWAELTDELLGAGYGRDACVVAVGGGVTGDLAGFVAATYLRGIPVVQVPTSYLAMIDASVGGKTGVDVDAGKNLVGAFHPPKLVVVDPLVLATLDRAERAQGLVEAFKHGAILDAAYFDALARGAGALLDAEPAAATEAVVRSVRIKAGVVAADEHEHGRRQILNFGHTLGHALEAASEYRTGHGAAVATGMLLEAELGERLGVTATGTRERLSGALAGLGLGRPAAGGPTAERVLSYLGADKKARAGTPRFVLLRSVGEVHSDGGWSHEAPPELVAEVVGSALEDPNTL